jgi:hypothetical protein
MQKNLAALGALALLAVPAASNADQTPTFTYRLKVPAGTASCADHANTIAAQFAAGARTQRTTGACEGRQTLVDQNQKYAIDVVVVTYQADSEKAPQRSIFGANAFMNVGEASAGVFKTYAECLEQLALQIPIFTAETGVTPVAGYCTASTQQEFYPGFSLTLESFGDLKKRLYTYSEDGISYPDHSQVIAASLTALRAAGADVVWSDNTRVFYYNDGDVNVSAENLGMFDDVSQCTSQTADASAIYQAAGLVGVSSFCRIDEPVAGHKFAVLMAVGAGPNEISDIQGDRYDSFDECRGDLPRVIQNNAAAGRTVYGGLCSPNVAGNGGFNAHVYVGF